MTAPEMTIRAVLGREPGSELEQLPVPRSAAVWRDQKRVSVGRSVEWFGRWQARLEPVRAFVGVFVGGIIAAIVVALVGAGIAFTLAAIAGAFLAGAQG